jgi:hypothetical protein
MSEPNATLSGTPGARIATDLGERNLAHVLGKIAEAGGMISPTANPTAKNGYEFAALGPDQTSLPLLAELGYLEKHFVDRVNLCPRCESHHLNIREVCPNCRTPNLSDEVLLHHFRCGYVGRRSEFETPERDRACPKCSRALRHLGTEYDRLGKTFRCNACGTSFQDPPVDALCLSCGARNSAEDMPTIDVFAFTLTSQGVAAVQRGKVEAPNEQSLLVDGRAIYRESVMREFLGQEARRSAFFQREFCVLVLDVQEELRGEAEPLFALVEGLSRRLRDIDIVGRLSPTRFAVMLPQTGQAECESIGRRLTAALGSQSPLGVFPVVVRKPQDLVDILATAPGAKE